MNLWLTALWLQIENLKKQNLIWKHLYKELKIEFDKINNQYEEYQRNFENIENRVYKIFDSMRPR